MTRLARTGRPNIRGYRRGAAALLLAGALGLLSALAAPNGAARHVRAQGAALAPMAQLGGTVEAVSVLADGHTILLGQGPRVIVLDACAPSAPEWRGASPLLPGVVRHIARDGTLVYVAVGEAGVIILDVADPAAPAIVGRFDVNGVAAKTILDGPWAYVVAGSEGLAIYDRAADPRAPQFVQVFQAVVSDAAVKGDWAFVVSRNLKLVDIRDRRNPDERQAMVDWADSVEVHGNVLLVGVSDNPIRSQRQGRLWAFDVTDPERSRPLIGTRDVGTPVKDIAMVGDQAWLLTQTQVLGVDVSNPRAMKPLPGTLRQVPSTGAGLAPRGQHLLLAAGRDGLWSVDRTGAERSAAALSLERARDTLGSAGAVALAGGVALVEDEPADEARGQGVVRIVDARAPRAPRLAGSLPGPVAARALWTDGALAVWGDDRDRLRLADVTDPWAPRLLGTLQLPEPLWAIAVRGERAYVANDRSVRIVDIGDPRAPVVLGQMRPEAGATDIALLGAPCCVVISGPDTRRDTGHDGLEVISVENPARPFSVGKANIDGWRSGLAAKGALVAAGEEALQLLDAAQLARPTVIGRLPMPRDGESEGRAWVGERLVEAVTIADTAGVVRLVDVAEPAAPRQVATFDALGSAQAVAAAGDVVALAAGETGLWWLGVDGGPPAATPAPPPQRQSQVIFMPLAARGAVGAACR